MELFGNDDVVELWRELAAILGRELTQNCDFTQDILYFVEVLEIALDFLDGYFLFGNAMFAF